MTKMTGRIKNNLKKWNARRAAVLALALSLLLSACGGEPSATSMRLKKTVGEVRVNDDKDNGLEIRDDLGLYSGYAVNTESESYAWLNLDSVKLAKLDESSKIAIEKDGGDLTINLQGGSFFFDITEPLGDDESLTLRTSTLAVGIRGTRGWVEVPEEGEAMRVYLLEGKVECTAGEQTAMVEAGEMAALTADGEITVENLPDGAIPAFVREELGDGTADSAADARSSGTAGDSEPVFVPWEQTGQTDHAMDWRDENLAKKMVEITGISDREIRLSDVWNETWLELTEAGISDVSSLGELTNLTYLGLGKNQISDISPLRSLTNLTGLSLAWNQISDISPLGSLTSLTQLDLYENQISGISPLGNLTNLTMLELGNNQISDISPLGNLTNLTQLYLDGNLISDISALRNLANLTELYLEGNPISDTGVLDGRPNLTIVGP